MRRVGGGGLVLALHYPPAKESAMSPLRFMQSCNQISSPGERRATAAVVCVCVSPCDFMCVCVMRTVRKSSGAPEVQSCRPEEFQRRAGQDFAALHNAQIEKLRWADLPACCEFAWRSSCGSIFPYARNTAPMKTTQAWTCSDSVFSFLIRSWGASYILPTESVMFLEVRLDPTKKKHGFSSLVNFGLFCFHNIPSLD